MTSLVSVTEVCAILHNLLLQMSQIGECKGEASEEGVQNDIVTQLFDEVKCVVLGARRRRCEN